MSTTEKGRLVSLLTTSKVPHDVPTDAIVIIGGVRTPITKATRGGLKDYKADQLLAVVLKVQLPSNILQHIPSNFFVALHHPHGNQFLRSCASCILDYAEHCDFAPTVACIYH